MKTFSTRNLCLDLVLSWTVFPSQRLNLNNIFNSLRILSNSSVTWVCTRTPLMLWPALFVCRNHVWCLRFTSLCSSKCDPSRRSADLFSQHKWVSSYWLILLMWLLLSFRSQCEHVHPGGLHSQRVCGSLGRPARLWVMPHSSFFFFFAVHLWYKHLRVQRINENRCFQAWKGSIKTTMDNLTPQEGFGSDGRCWTHWLCLLSPQCSWPWQQPVVTWCGETGSWRIRRAWTLTTRSTWRPRKKTSTLISPATVPM